MSKIKQKLTSIVKSNSIRYGKLQDDRIILTKKDYAEFPILLYSTNELSPHYPIYTSNTGMLDVTKSVTSFVGLARKEKRKGGASVVYVEKEVYNKGVEVHADVEGFSSDIAYLVDEKNLGKSFSVSKATLLIVGFASVSESRAGSLVYMPKGVNRRDYLVDKLGFKFDYFVKQKWEDDKEIRLFDTIKSYTRVKMAASDGKEMSLFKGYSYSEGSDVTKTYKGIDEDVESKSLTFNADGDEKLVFEIFNQDFQVEMHEELVMPVFKTDDERINVVEKKRLIVREATDGAVYIDAAWARKHGLKQAVQFRFTTLGKGMLILVPNLKKLTGSTMMLFGGAVKGDIELALKENILDFFVLNKARRTKAKNSLLLSRQVFGAIANVNPEILRGLTKETALMLDRLFNHDMDSLKEFVGIDDTEVSEEETLDSENLTIDTFRANPEAFMQSASSVRKLDSLIRASIGEVERGARLYVKDASIKHMVVDPLAIVHYISRGYMGVKANEVEQVGIRRGQFITSGLSDWDTFYIEHEKAFLARFPFLHEMEGRLVNTDGGSPFIDEFTANLYDKYISHGDFQGLGIYSLWDMNPEAQSGADFDGDTTIYTTNKLIVDHFKQQPLFLDYSLLDGKVVEGVPWKGEGFVLPLELIVENKDIRDGLESQGVSYNKGVFSYPKELHGNLLLENILADAMALNAAASNESNFIGLFTNVNSTVMELIYRLNAVIRRIDMQKELTPALEIARESVAKEVDGYKKLSFLLACAIRWEIDKAKHGGDFMLQLPFLNYLTEGAPDVESVRRMEERFGISLERLFFEEIK